MHIKWARLDRPLHGLFVDIPPRVVWEREALGPGPGGCVMFPADTERPSKALLTAFPICTRNVYRETNYSWQIDPFSK